MRRLFQAAAGLVMLAVVAGCANRGEEPFVGPVTQLLVQKGERKMHLLSGNQIVKTYEVGLGFAPDGTKMFEGDGRTPEGTYFIDRVNPNSRYHLSLGISYPAPQDIERARAMGVSPGSDIFIHGQGPEGQALSKQMRDWTAGCIAVTDEEMEEIFQIVRAGVPITIVP
ncbi:L,D-transpeptidase family protein [Paracoccus sp. S-4012]|uniref:L,D-transpeptidase family protein n=1 Tax=Paracoccus sp. S-4012 TaxID=2665648 RepID=UPI0012B00D97|nr:L,D-transpeptidase family protein [Paracoccus sp. S-4012]MRX49284.1 L,D-transpeptidase family protein [Paracoccus sp. S-4012]